MKGLGRAVELAGPPQRQAQGAIQAAGRQCGGRRLGRHQAFQQALRLGRVAAHGLGAAQPIAHGGCVGAERRGLAQRFAGLRVPALHTLAGRALQAGALIAVTRFERCHQPAREREVGIWVAWARGHQLVKGIHCLQRAAGAQEQFAGALLHLAALRAERNGLLHGLE